MARKHFIDKRQFRIGDVFMMEFTGVAHEQRGVRPAVVFQNNVGNKYSPNIIALPFTSVLKKQHLPTHVLIRASQSGLSRDSIVLCENPERVSKDRVGEYITTLNDAQMRQIAVASLIATSAIAFLDAASLQHIRNEAMRYNNLLKN